MRFGQSCHSLLLSGTKTTNGALLLSSSTNGRSLMSDDGHAAGYERTRGARLKATQSGRLLT